HIVTSRLIVETDRHRQAPRAPEFSRRLAGTVPACYGPRSGPSRSPSARWRGLLLLPSLRRCRRGGGGRPPPLRRHGGAQRRPRSRALTQVVSGRGGKATMKANACIAALVGALAAAPPAPAAVPRDLHAGVRVRLQATMTRPRTVVAEGVEIVAGAEGEDGLKAVIETVDPEAKTLTALGIKIVASDSTVLQGERDERVSFSAIRPGRRVSAKGTFRGDATLVASKLSLRPE